MKLTFLRLAMIGMVLAIVFIGLKQVIRPKIVWARVDKDAPEVPMAESRQITEYSSPYFSANQFRTFGSHSIFTDGAKISLIR